MRPQLIRSESKSSPLPLGVTLVALAVTADNIVALPASAAIVELGTGMVVTPTIVVVPPTIEVPAPTTLEAASVELATAASNVLGTATLDVLVKAAAAATHWP